MSVFVNDKGGAEHRVTLLKRGQGTIQNVMLNNVLIKKSENYHLQCDRFVTNSLPGISQLRTDLIRIYPKMNYNIQDDGFDLGIGAQYQLYRKSTFTIAGPHPQLGDRVILSNANLIYQICQFINDFNLELFIQGANFSAFLATDPVTGLAVNVDYIVPTHALANQRHDIINDIDPTTVVQYISAGVDTFGRLQLNLSSQFLTNFYIMFDEIFAAQIGFPNMIYAHNHNVLGQINTQISTDLTTDDLLFQLVPGFYYFALQPEVNEGVNIVSTKSLFNVDDRLSYDLEISLPLSMSIDTVDGKETQTYLLSRFQITDYQDVQTRAKQKDGLLLTEALIDDKLHGGKIDLVRGEPSSHVSQLLNGKIQALDLRVILRYKEYYLENGKIKFNIARRTLDMGDHGFYDLLLQFNKRVG